MNNERSRPADDLPPTEPHCRPGALPAGARWGPPGDFPLQLPGKYARYVLLQRLGETGGSAEVYFASDEDRLGKSVAIKFLTEPTWPTDLFREEGEIALDIERQGFVLTLSFLKMQ